MGGLIPAMLAITTCCRLSLEPESRSERSALSVARSSGPITRASPVAPGATTMAGRRRCFIAYIRSGGAADGSPEEVIAGRATQNRHFPSAADVRNLASAGMSPPEDETDTDWTMYDSTEAPCAGRFSICFQGRITT